jgi:hypothetical protein
MNYSDLILFIDNFLDRDSMWSYLIATAEAVQTAWKTASPPRMLRCNINFGALPMNTTLTDFVDRVAMTFGQLAMLAALPVAAIALAVHAL